MDIIQACLTYTLRVLAAWWFIKTLRDWMLIKWPNWPTVVFYVSVFVGAEITFVLDYLIFNHMVFNH